ncbi:unnamed protein product, partial [Phaeothamnion confervicola]
GASVELLVGAAAAAGHLEVLKALHDDGLVRQPARIICHEAAGNGHVDVLAWARGAGFRWSLDPSAWAARHGHIPVIKWLHANRCCWSLHSTTVAAATAGHVA